MTCSIDKAVQRCYAIADDPTCVMDFTQIIAKVVLETGVSPVELLDAWSTAEDDHERDSLADHTPAHTATAH